MKARLTAWELWWIFADRFLDWEEGVWRTFVQMAKSPGRVIRHYLGGKRKTYLNPFSYVLFCAALYVLGQFVLRRIPGITTVPNVQKMQEWGMALNEAEDEFTMVAYGTVGAVALVAVAMRVMFDGRLLNAMEAVVTSLYASGNVFLLSLLISAVELVVTGDPLPVQGLFVTFIVLFPVCVGHAGLGLFEDWGMACYTAMTPIIAAVLGFGMFLVGTGLSALVVEMVGGAITGNLMPVLGGIVVLFLVLGPAVVPFLTEMYG